MTVQAAEMRHDRQAWPRQRWPGRPRLKGVILLGNCVAAAAPVAAAMILERFQVSDVWATAGVIWVATVAVALSGAVVARQVVEPMLELLSAIDAGGERTRQAGRPAARLAALSERDDEIGRLSRALDRMVSALSDRIASNEDLAADVAHEIRNPLASLKSAAESLKSADDAQRGKLIEIVGQDVARLDRLVGEISSASRLDAELVREDAVEFDLIAMVGAVVQQLSPSAASRGIDIIVDLPEEPVIIAGLDARLAQVVVNVLENAISLCEEGDAIRVWMRRRDARILFVVEDTGPGIPDGAAEKIFRRFYSCRPAQFGANSGLGLAISRQIVDAHAGVIWAENIRPTRSDLLSEPLGARFVVMLPLCR